MVMFNHSNVSGAHCAFSKEGKYFEIADSGATHKTVIAQTKLMKEVRID